MARTVIVRDSGLCSALLVPSRVDGCRELLPSVSFPFLRSLSISSLSFFFLFFSYIIAKQPRSIAERIDRVG